SAGPQAARNSNIAAADAHRPAQPGRGLYGKVVSGISAPSHDDWTVVHNELEAAVRGDGEAGDLLEQREEVHFLSVGLGLGARHPGGDRRADRHALAGDLVRGAVPIAAAVAGQGASGRELERRTPA